ncbi:AAA family ATPase [Chryseomicrobium aureum]|uniref:AAA family ATPase n=1 Tax=Chryseomicrobium aureum TaxID=1441723 RepID=UPI00370DD36B
MGQNIIFYGPPGTGKTYTMQKLKNKYTAYDIEDEIIVDAYINTSKDWLLVTLILLQNNGPMTNAEIHARVEVLPFPVSTSLNIRTSSILENHSIGLNPIFTSREPKVFYQIDSKWFVDVDKVSAYHPTFLEDYLSQDNIEERFKFVTFHQSFVYEDFIEGIRPVVADEGENIDEETSELKYTVQPGVFKEVCQIAEANPHNNYAIFIDEINRGNISSIFGELITLIEPDKRLGEVNQLEIILPYSKSKFGVPKNLDIYGTMNSTDRSIALLDIALRRRFKFIEQTYRKDHLIKIMEERGINPRDIEGIDLVMFIEAVNRRIEVLLDANFILGHAFFTNLSNFNDLKEVVVEKIIPLLEEYFYDDLQKIQLIFSDLDEDGELKHDVIYKHQELDADRLFEYPGEYELENKKSYRTNYDAGTDAFKKVYTN